jgi:iron complex outermembrane receptor protein
VDIFRFAGSSVPGQASGNLDLNEETADTYTLGAVWQSKSGAPLLRRLSASVDFYDIKVRDAIGVITAQVGLSRCFNGDGSSNPNYDSNSFFCQLTTRNASGSIELQLQPTLNLAAYEVSGLDFQLDYGFSLDDVGLTGGGDLTFNTVVSYLDKYKIQNLADAPFLEYAGTIGNAQIDPGATAFPRWKLNLAATYSIGPAQLTATYRWYDKLSHYSDVGVTNPSRPGSAAIDYVDLIARIAVTDDIQLRAGIQNLFDTEPPEWVGLGATDLGLYDIVQRRYFVGVRTRF